MTTRSRWDAGSQIFFEDAKMETVAAMAPVQFSEEFIGAGHSAGFPTSATAGYAWIKKIVGAAPPTAALVANGAAGVAQLALTSTSEKQEATLYFADNLALDVTKKLQAEFTAALTVAPSAASVQAVFGLAQAWADGPDNIARYLEFGLRRIIHCCCAPMTGQLFIPSSPRCAPRQPSRSLRTPIRISTGSTPAI